MLCKAYVELSLAASTNGIFAHKWIQSCMSTSKTKTLQALLHIYYLQQLGRHGSLVNKEVYVLSEQGLAETLHMLKFSFAGGG